MSKADPKTLELIYEHYRRGVAEREAEELWWKAEELSFEQACGRAAKALRANGKIHSHHR